MNAKRLGLILLESALLACGSPVVLVDPSLLPDGVAVLFRVGATGRVLGEPSTFAVAGGRIEFGDPSLEAEQDEVYLLTFSEMELPRIAPGYDLRRRDQISVKKDVATTDVYSDPVVTRLPQDLWLRRVLEGGERSFTEVAGAELASALSSLVLSIPSNADFCADRAGPELRAFGARGELMPPDEPLPGWTSVGTHFERIRSVHAVSRDRVLAVTLELLFVVDRGGSIAAPSSDLSAPRRTLVADALGPEGKRFQPFDAVLEPAGVPPGEVVLWVAGQVPEPGAPHPSGQLVELRIDEAGLRRVRTATLTEWPLTTLMIDETGALLVGGNAGALLVRPRGEALRRAPTPPELEGIDINVIRPSHDPNRPQVLGTALQDELVAFGNVATGEWGTFARARDPSQRGFGTLIGILDISAAPDGSEVWAVGADALIRRWDRTNGWVGFDLRLTQTAKACSGGKEFGASHAQTNAVCVDDEFVFTLAASCSGALAIDRSGKCTGAVPLPEGPIAPTTASLYSLHDEGDRILVAGDHAQIYELYLEP
ncbi:MAG: hypothetical protein HYV07_17520 [Deltaproteobacteria bacterium]|nr:hypothetical protein [Deltaproteobacteria bacterium]